MSIFCQSSCGGREAMYSLTSFRSLSNRISCASKWTRRPLRNRKSTVRPAPGGLGHAGSNWPQAAEDLVELRFLPPSWSPYVVLASLQVLGRPVELAAVLEDRGQGVAGPPRRGRSWARRDLLVDLDRIELVGQREPLDAGGQPGDRLLVAERVERVGAGVLGLAVAGGRREVRCPASVCVPNWPSRKLASVVSVRVEQARHRLRTAWASAHRQRWPSFPAFAKLSRHAVIDRRARRRRRAPRLPACPTSP